MPKDNSLPNADELVSHKILLIRNQKVMLDRDLALLYGVETKHLKQAVKRNIPRFPSDFMFELSTEEMKDWRSQFVTSNSDKMGLRYAPMAFTEHGILMLSSVLNSERAIQANIQIVRVFSKMRQLLFDAGELKTEIDKIRNKVDNQSKNIELIFHYFDELTQKKQTPRQRLGYKK